MGFVVEGPVYATCTPLLLVLVGHRLHVSLSDAQLEDS
jgi:hypothetical protein